MADSVSSRTAKQHVGVVVPVRNGVRYLDETLTAVEAQTHAHWRGVIVVNASTDRTLDIAREHAQADGRWQVVEAAEPGVSRARNLGRNVLCDGGIPSAFWWLDADDVPDADLLEHLLAELTEQPQASAVHAVVHFHDADGKAVETTPALQTRLDRHVADCGELRRLPSDEPTTRLAIATWPCVITPGVVLARATAVLRTGDWNTDLSIGEDSEYWFRLMACGPMAFLDRPLLAYRLHEDSAGVSAKRRSGRRKAVRALVAATKDQAEQRDVVRAYQLSQWHLAAQRAR
ncbi:MAG: glycosyltransferase, partial [Planctomycetota bacterium]